jgi:2-amino-4-hydroxy-6-hydroxymethyldihydropteridine diphosphokinase
MPRAFISVGSNLGDAISHVKRGIDALRRVGGVALVSALYRTKPWGPVQHQPDFINAVVALDTDLGPRKLLEALQDLERELGRTPGPRFGPRTIDFDIAVFDELELEERDLVIPHRQLRKRAFVLVPLAEIDARFARWRDELPESERATVVKLPGRRSLPEGESIALMSDEHPRTSLVDRLRSLADWANTTDVARLRIEREGEEIELGRRVRPADIDAAQAAELSIAELAPAHLEAIKADLVGIFHFTRPVAVEGEILEGDRELAYIEALGIRNPVRSRGSGRVASIKRSEGDAVEYGAILFEIDRG